MTTPATPHPASTVVLVRPGADGGTEIFMNRRPEKMETYAGAYVFPGGRVEEADWSKKMLELVRGLSAVEARRILGADSAAEFCLGYWVAAARELFEEAGILFFVGADSAASSTAAGNPAERLTEQRRRLQRGTMNFPSLLESERFHCDVSRLTYFFHRITPEHYPVRFDTRFFLAALPGGQAPLHASEEVAESLWIAPHEALSRFESGAFRMAPPTVMVLRTLAQHKTWHALCSSFRLT
jgi:8-oxo-dGTP pyrophosphatase MutT (NUDIX family)